MAITTVLFDYSSVIAVTGIGIYFLAYIVYQRYFHPLAKYPGPFLASLTDVWQSYQFYTLQQPYHLTELHAKYGPFVRYGPDKLSTTCESAVPLIYQKGGRHMPKTEFYDAYGAAHPNVFGVRDEDVHSIRRRYMSHAFSISYVKEMEQYLDLNIAILKRKLARFASTGEAFDLKRALHFYVIDTLGELAFSQTFGIQEADDDSLVPPVVEHSLLAAVTGAWPAMTSTFKRWLPLVPYQPLLKLFQGRRECAQLASRCVSKRLHDLADIKDDEASIRAQRKDILTNLILARDPNTGERLTQTDLETEAFGFIIAGTHTTSATSALLFYHLLQNPDIMSRLSDELKSNLPPLSENEASHSITTLESSLPFLRNCMKENFRLTPVFTMPLARRVTAPDGVTIDGEHIPQGTSIAVCNHAFHHNPAVWGSDHNTFRPDRWDEEQYGMKSKYLMHFGLGGRQCIGKTIAMTNIQKLTATLLQEFEFDLAEPVKEKSIGPERNDVPRMVSVGISDLDGPLMVKCKKRTPIESN